MGGCGSKTAAKAARPETDAPASPAPEYDAPTAIHAACNANDSEALGEALRKAGTREATNQAFMTDSGGDTALAVAIRGGAEDCVAVLLAAAPEGTGGGAGSVLSEGTVKRLVQLARPGTGDTPLHVCARSAANVPVSVCCRIVKQLVAAGAELGKKNAFGNVARDVVPPKPVEGEASDLKDVLFDETGEIRVHKAA